MLMESAVLFPVAFRQSVSVTRILMNPCISTAWVFVWKSRCHSSLLSLTTEVANAPSWKQERVSLQYHPHCQNGHSLLWFIWNECLVPGWFPPAPSIRLHTPLPYIHALLVQFPFLRPEVLKAAFITGISVARSGAGVSLKKRIEVQR